MKIKQMKGVLNVWNKKVVAQAWEKQIEGNRMVAVIQEHITYQQIKNALGVVELPVNCMFCKVECIPEWQEDAEMWNGDTREFEPIEAHVSHNCPKCRMSYQRFL